MNTTEKIVNSISDTVGKAIQVSNDHPITTGIVSGLSGLLTQYINAATPILKFIILVVSTALVLKSAYATFFKKSPAEQKELEK